METLLRIGLSNTVAALLLAVLVIIVACVWRRPAVLHALWLLVLVKLVTPPLVWLPEPWTEAADAAAASGERQPPDDSPNQGADALRSPETADSNPTLVDDASADSPTWEAILVPAEDLPKTETASSLSPPVGAAAVLASTPAVPWWIVAAFGLWLVGTVTWFVLAFVRLRRFRRLLRHAVPAPESLRQRANRLAEKMRLRRRPAVHLVPGRVAPMLWAVGGPPCILFPSELFAQTTPEQQNALLVHELAHLRRRDHWVRWLEFAAAGLYWWNPVLWFARRELREAEEQCCDAWVTSTLPGAGKTYAVALLETLDFLSDARSTAPLLASGVGRVADLKRRLTMIMRGTTPRALSWRGLLAVLGLGALLLPLLPAWARAQPQPQQPPVKTDAPDQQKIRFLSFAEDDVKAAPADLDKVKAELKELEAQLERKQAETAELAAKVQALRAQLGEVEIPRKARFVIAVDGPDAKYADVLRQIQSVKPDGKSERVIVIDGASGRIIMQADGANPPGAPPPPPEGAQKWIVVPRARNVAPAQPGQPAAPPPPNPPPSPRHSVGVGPPPAADADKRIDELEMKLKSIMDEVEKLRHERKPDAPREDRLHSYGPAPLDQIPYIRRLIKTAPPDAPEDQVRFTEDRAKELTAVRDALQARMEELKATAATSKAQNDAAVEEAHANLNAAAAELKRAEAVRERTDSKVKAGAAPEIETKQAQADLEARRAALEEAKVALTKASEDNRRQATDIEAKLKAAEEERQVAEEKVKQLENELRKLQEAPKKR
jgi:beta-lactamase regulating signal transducer with metallopeptidase domain